MMLVLFQRRYEYFDNSIVRGEFKRAHAICTQLHDIAVGLDSTADYLESVQLRATVFLEEGRFGEVGLCLTFRPYHYVTKD